MTNAAVLIGKVTTARRGRLHLNVNGHSRCHSGRQIIGKGHVIQPNDEPRLCRHCRPAITNAVIALLAGSLGGGNGTGATQARVSALNVTAETLATPAQAAADADLAARIAATIQAAPLIRPLPRDEQWDAWEAARDSYDATHLPAAA